MRSGRSVVKDEVADRRSRFQQAVRLRGITHRYNGVHDRFDRAGLYQRQDVTADTGNDVSFLLDGTGSEHCRGDACTFEDQQAEIQRGGGEVAADDDQVAVDCQAVQVAFEVVGADDVEDGIEPTAVGTFPVSTWAPNNPSWVPLAPNSSPARKVSNLWCRSAFSAA